MANPVAQAQALQQQTQTNCMLNQLPEEQRAQIEQGVSIYRAQLLNQGYDTDLVQGCVWTYYTQCVQKMFQDFKQKDWQGRQQQPPQQPPPPPPPQDSALHSLHNQTSDAIQHGQHQEQHGLVRTSQQLQAMQLAQRQQQQQQQMPFQPHSQPAQNCHQPQQQLQASMLSHQMGGQSMGMTLGQSMGSTMGAGSVQGMNGFGTGMGALGAAVAVQQQQQRQQQQQQQQEEIPQGMSFAADGMTGVGASPNEMFTQGLMSDSAVGQHAQANTTFGSSMGNLSSQKRLAAAAAAFDMAGQTPKMASGMLPSWKCPPNPGSCMTSSMMNNTGTGVRFPLTMRRPPGMGLRADTPVARLQMQQAQHEHRLLQQQQQQQQHQQHQNQQQSGSSSSQVARPLWGTASRIGSVSATSMTSTSAGGFSQGPPAAFRNASASRPPRPPAAPSAGAVRPGPQFPPALQKWLQRLFAHQTTCGDSSDPDHVKLTHNYLRHWVQQWVKTGELYKKNWETAALPTPEEIRGNLPPGTLGGRAANHDGLGGHAGSAEARRGGCDNDEEPLKRAKPREGFSARTDRSLQGSPANRSRSHSAGHPAGRRRTRTPHRRRRSPPSSSRSRSRSKSAHDRAEAEESSQSRDASRSRDASPRDERHDSPGRNQTSAWWGKGKAKGKGDAGHQASRRGSFEEQRDKVHAFLLERLEAAEGRNRHKELQEEIQRTFGVNSKRFRALFQQTLPQYISAYVARGPSGPEEAWANTKTSSGAGILRAGPKVLSQGEQEMRAQRAARFQTHLQVEKASVAMVSFNDGEGAFFDGGPIIGELVEMCSREEAREREQTRQLDKLEWKVGTDPRHPEVNLALTTKKYQRSSADKAYRSQDVRTLEACWRTMEYLMTEILDFDCNPKPPYAVQDIPYIEVYSYLRDRTRSVRVDLHLQQPRSTTQRTFVETHECCLRFEMLSLFLLSGGTGGSTEKYDEKLGLKAISQTIEPLLNSYQAVRDKQFAKSILAEAMGDLGLDDADEDKEYSSPWEPATRRYIVLLLMSFSPDELLTHLAKLSKDMLAHPVVNFATQVYAAFQTDDYGRFLRLYRHADFLTAVAMSGVADLARLRALWLLFRTYPHPVGDKVALSRMRNFLAFASDAHARSFLAFHGIRIVEDASVDGGAYVVLPKKGSAEAAQNQLLTGPSRLPEKCDYPKGADSMLVSKFEALGMSRADIIFGSADPIAEVDTTLQEANLPEDSGDKLVDGDSGYGSCELGGV